jgi:hypothetical protein
MIALDIETLDFFSDDRIKRLPRPIQLLAMRFGCAYTLDMDTGAWTGYWPEDPGLPTEQDVVSGPTALPCLWQHLINQTIVGWNLFEFDIPYLMLHLNRHCDNDGDPWLDPMRIIDLMAVLKTASKPFGKERWYKLDVIAATNLGRGKLGNGQQAATWLQSGDPALLRQAAAYCREDVQLTADLFQTAQTTGLLCPARPERSEVGDLRVWLNTDGDLVDCRREE